MLEDRIFYGSLEVAFGEPPFVPADADKASGGDFAREEWAGGISNLRPQRPDGLVAITSL